MLWQLGSVLAVFPSDGAVVLWQHVRQGDQGQAVGRAYSYLQLVEGYRDERGRVRHRVVANLGREDELKASGQLEQLMGSFARLDPPLAGMRRRSGRCCWLALHRELDLIGTVDAGVAAAPVEQLSVGEVVAR